MTGHRPLAKMAAHGARQVAAGISFALLVWVGLSLCWASIPAAWGWHPQVVLSGSMGPAISTGDVVLTAPVKPDELRPGAVILADTPAQPGHTYLHRVVATGDGTLVTRGDANASNDYPPLRPAAVRGQARLVVPRVGLPMVWAQQHRPLPLIGVFAALLACLLAARPLLFPGKIGFRRASRRASRPRLRTSATGVGLLALLALPFSGLSLPGVAQLAGPGTSAVFSSTTPNGSNSLTATTWVPGDVLKWFGAGGSGQGGVWDFINSTPVQDATAATTWQRIASGEKHSCAVRTGGTLWCWGYNLYGQLGIGSTVQQTSPVQVGTGTIWDSVAAGQLHTCATRTDGTLWCWGYNAQGPLGIGSTTQQNSPIQVGTDTTWASVTAGYRHTCVLASFRRETDFDSEGGHRACGPGQAVLGLD